MSDYAPKLVCFTCNFGWGYLADKGKLAETIQRWIPVACSGKVDSVHVLRAFKEGADGVLILGCPDGECHFQDGNYQTKKKVLLLKKVLATYGLEPERLRMILSADPDGTTIVALIAEMGEELSALGPVTIRRAALAAA